MGNSLGDLISRGEGGYNSYNRGTAGDAHGDTIDFSQMTLAEVQRRQHLAKHDPERLFAVGKYQIIPGTLDAAVSGLRLDSSQRFTPELQERIFSEYLIRAKRPDIHGYIVGKAGVSLHDAQEAVSAEWASVADPDTGKSKYGGIGGNKASISADKVALAVGAMRAEYSASLARGSSPVEAWRVVTGQDEAVARSRNVADVGSGAMGVSPGSSAPKHGGGGLDVERLQSSLNRLGYHDGQGHPLREDGDFGDRTREAVLSFQRAHGLKADGIVGPRTMGELQKAERQPLLSDARHPDHGMYKDAVTGLENVAGKAGLHNRQELERAAATLVFEAKASGMSRIDHVVPSTNGSGLFAVQGGLSDAAHLRVHVDKAQAASQPVEQSTYQLQADVQQRTAFEPAQQREPRVLSI